MTTPFFSVTNLYHALPSLPHCATFKHLNYNLCIINNLLHTYILIITPYYTRCTYSYLTPYTPFLYDILYSKYSHTNSYYSTFNSPPSSTHQHDQIHPSTSSSRHIIHIAQHTDSYFKAWCAPSQISNITIFISLCCNLKIHAGTRIHHLCSMLYNT